MNEVVVKAFVQRLLNDWEQDEYQIDAEFGVDGGESMKHEIAARRAEWSGIVDG